MRKRGITIWSVRHPAAVVLIAMAVVALGLYAAARLPVEFLRQADRPGLHVRLSDPGVPADILEEKVTRHVEEHLARGKGWVRIASFTTEGGVHVALGFPPGTAPDEMRRAVAGELDRARSDLPATLDAPVISTDDVVPVVVMDLAVRSTQRSPAELRVWLQETLAKQFLDIPGVADVRVIGGARREIHVVPDQRRLAALGLSLDTVIGAVRRAIARAGTAQPMSAAVVAALPVRLPNAETIALAELASVSEGTEPDGARVRINGQPAAWLMVLRHAHANTVAVAERVKARLAWLHANDQLPRDIRIERVFNQATGIKRSLRRLGVAVGAGAGVALLAAWLVLGSGSATVVAGGALLTAFAAALAVLAAAGLTVNQITLGGFAIGAGLLLAAPVIVLERMLRNRRSGVRPLGGPQGAAIEVQGVMVTAAICLAAAVLPGLVMGGLVGRLYRDLVIVVLVLVLAGLLAGLSLVPAIAPWLGRRHRGPGRLIGCVADGLAATAARMLGRSRLLAAGALVLGVASATAVFAFPAINHRVDLETGTILLYVDHGAPALPAAGPATLDPVEHTVLSLERLIAEAGDGVESVLSMMAGAAPAPHGPLPGHAAVLRVRRSASAAHATSDAEWVARLQVAIDAARLPGVVVRAAPLSTPPPIDDTGLDACLTYAQPECVSAVSAPPDLFVRVSGPDPETLTQIGREIERRLQAIRAIAGTQSSGERVRAGFRVEIKPQAAMHGDVDAAQVARALRVGASGLVVEPPSRQREERPVRVLLPGRPADNPTSLYRILLFGETAGRPAVYIGDVAEVMRTDTAPGIHREDGRPVIRLGVTIAYGASSASAMTAVRAAVSQQVLPSGYQVYVESVAGAHAPGKATFALLPALALLLVVAVLFEQYKSRASPLAIANGALFALAGAAIGLTGAGQPVSLAAAIGMSILVGACVLNAHLVVQSIERRKSWGRPAAAAVARAVRRCAPPVLATTLTAVGGVLPLALGLGDERDALQPLAIALLGGLVLSVPGSLLLVPATYFVLCGDAVTKRRGAPGRH